MHSLLWSAFATAVRFVAAEASCLVIQAVLIDCTLLSRNIAHCTPLCQQARKKTGPTLKVYGSRTLHLNGTVTQPSRLLKHEGVAHPSLLLREANPTENPSRGTKRVTQASQALQGANLPHVLRGYFAPSGVDLSH
mmetsp:Transcript_100735/g.174023  ORF Transcript_100735/g.174023 Transcript_100735/m.174023 type:complete len:136 (-) Transcript_100735:2-409(-)